MSRRRSSRRTRSSRTRSKVGLPTRSRVAASSAAAAEREERGDARSPRTGMEEEDKGLPTGSKVGLPTRLRVMVLQEEDQEYQEDEEDKE